MYKTFAAFACSYHDCVLPKFFRFMKLTALVWTVILIQLTAFARGQNVSLSVSNAAMEQVLNDLSKQSGQHFLYDLSVIRKAAPVTVHVKNVPLERALSLCFANQPFSYVFDGSDVIIKLKPAGTTVAAPPVKITGTVMSEAGKPLAGVTVKVKATAAATATDQQGKFTIQVPDLKAVLIFSSVGYMAQELMLNNRSSISVVMMESNAVLDEVVVLGYGTAKRKDVTGSVGKVAMEDFAKAPVKSFDDALAGRVAGVQVSSTDGQPGDMSNIVIRGAGSITQDNSPLYVIDGFTLENGNANSISPDDIESIDVLKDASATAIYGARGANGVIVITTKKGKKGATVVNYNGYYGRQQNIKTMELMNPYEYVKYQLELYPTLATPRYLANGRTLDSYKEMEGTNFQKLIYRDAPMHNHNIAIRGGNDRTLFSISGNIVNQEGIIINSGFKRYQGRVVLDHTVNNKFKLGINANYSNSVYYGIIPKSDNSTNASSSYLYSVWGYRPISLTGNLDDDFYDPDIDPSGDYRVNPFISVSNALRRTNNNTLLANAYLEYQVVPSLKLRISGGVTNNMIREEAFYNSLTAEGNPRNISGVNGFIDNSPNTNLLNENTLSWKKTFNKSHTIDALVGYTIQYNNSSFTRLSAFNVPNESLGLDGLDQSLSLSALAGSSRWRLQSYLGRVNYAFKSKWLLTASFRTDGSSKFAPGRRWGYFPSGAVAWRLSEEKFIRRISAVSNAKLRLSYGQTGNNRVSDFPYLSQLTAPVGYAYSYNNGSPSMGAAVSALGNPMLKWETTTQTNIGFDLGLFNQRIDLSVDMYRKTTRDLLLNALLPYTTGMSSAFKNVGKMQNQGIELTLNTINLNRKGFVWNSSFNISFNANKVLSLTENQTALATPVAFDNKWRSLPPYIAVLGQSVAQMYGAIWEGVYNYDDFNKTAAGTYVLKAGKPNNGNPAANIQPGDIKYRDINGDGTINSADFTIIGRGIPLHTGGFSNNFTYKQFDLNVFLQWSYGNNIINANKLIFEGNEKVTRDVNQFASYENRWTPENPDSKLFRTNGQGPSVYSSRLVEDGSYLRLKTVSLGYSLGKLALQRLKIKSARFYVSAQNLLTVTNYSGPDPEVSARNSTLTPGFDFSAYPRARTVIVGVNVSL